MGEEHRQICCLVSSLSVYSSEGGAAWKQEPVA